MKRFLLLLPFLALLIAACEGPSSRFPKPTSGGTIIRGQEDEEGEENEQRKREEWMEQMHRTGPGVNWRAMDEQSRWAKYQQYCGMSGAANKTTTADTLAGGLVIGTWKERGSVNNAGRIVYAELDTTTNMIYAAADGGQVFRGTWDATGWTPLNDKLRIPGIKSVRMLPLAGGGKRLLVAGYKRIWRTEDEGATWNFATGLEGVNGWGWIKRMIVKNDSAHTIFLLLYEWDYVNWNGMTALYKSTDMGVSFTQLQTWGEPTFGGQENFDIWTDRFGTSGDVFLMRNENVYRLDPLTSALIAVSTLPGTVPTGTTLLTGAEIGGKTYLYSFNNQDIFRSTDDGNTWTLQGNIGKSPFMENSFAMSRHDTDLVYFGDVEVWRSTDAGGTWAHVSDWWNYYSNVATKLHADIPAILPVYDASGNEFQFIGTDGGLYRSTDDIVNVNNLSLFGLNVSQYYTVYTNRVNTNYIYVGTQDQGYQRCKSDSGTVLGFDQVVSGDYGHIVSSNGGQSVWCVYPGFADYYPNATTGTSSASWDFNGTNPLWMPPLMAHPTDYWKCYMAGGHIDGSSGSKIMMFTAIGGSVSVSELAYDFQAASSGGFITDLNHSPVNTSRWYVVTDNGHFFYSTNSGSSWSETSSFTAPGGHYFYGARILPSKIEPLTVYAAGSGYSNPGVWESTDGGVTFDPIDTGLPATLVYDLDMNDDGSLLFAATEIGPYIYIRSKGQWYAMGSGSPDQVYWEVDYVSSLQTARFATYGRGLWDFAIDFFVAADKPVAAAPSFTVSPNPASEVITMAWGAPLSSAQTLRIIDTQGKSVKVWTAEGGCTTSLADVSGLTPGIYFCLWQNGDHRETRKLVIAR